jgi:hypothetical protein
MILEQDLRWIATVDYLIDAGVLQEEFRVEELFELHDLIERGPDWNTIEKITIELNPRRSGGRVTVEEAREL